MGNTGDVASLKCVTVMKFGSPLIGERGNSFMVTLRLEVQSADEDYTPVARTGYAEMWRALWSVRNTKSCEHVPRIGDKITIEPDCMTISRFEGLTTESNAGRVVIFLTACNLAARWNALCKASYSDSGNYQVLLRGEDCCFKCAVEQAICKEGKCYLVL